MKGKFRFAVPELSLKMTDEQTLQVKNLEINVSTKYLLKLVSSISKF
jgi:hypothetical protein